MGCDQITLESETKVPYRDKSLNCCYLNRRSHREFDVDIAECAGVTLQLDNELGDLQLGKLSQKYISDPDLGDLLAETVLNTNKMKRLEDQKLLLITSVVYSEKFELHGDRKSQVFIICFL